jgi:hypothetical protein
MYSSRLALVGRLSMALLAVLVLGGLAAAAAQAEEAPRWSREGKNLAQGETHYITAKTYTTKANPGFTLAAMSHLAVACDSVKLREGVISGSSAGNPGTNNEVIEVFGNCRLTGNGGNCKVKEPIATSNLKSELVEDEKKEHLLMGFFPENGSVFVTLHFEGSECKTGNPSSINMTGAVAAEVLTDPNNGELGEKVLPNNKREATSWLLNFPETLIKKVLLIKGGVGEEVKTELTAFALYATLTGTALISLANKNHEAEEINWSF